MTKRSPNSSNYLTSIVRSKLAEDANGNIYVFNMDGKFGKSIPTLSIHCA